MYRVKKKKVYGESSRPYMALVKIPVSYWILGPLGYHQEIIEHKYEFQMREQGEIIEKIDAKDVYAQYPTHDTYEKFIAHWMADQNVQTKSTLNLSCTFSQTQRRRLSNCEFEGDGDNNEKD